MARRSVGREFRPGTSARCTRTRAGRARISPFLPLFLAFVAPAAPGREPSRSARSSHFAVDPRPCMRRAEGDRAGPTGHADKILWVRVLKHIISPFFTPLWYRGFRWGKATMTQKLFSNDTLEKIPKILRCRVGEACTAATCSVLYYSMPVIVNRATLSGDRTTRTRIPGLFYASFTTSTSSFSKLSKLAQF